jgi:hypothetical protein
MNTPYYPRGAPHPEKPFVPSTPSTVFEKPKEPSPPRLRHHVDRLKPGTIIRGQIYTEFTQRGEFNPYFDDNAKNNRVDDSHRFETKWGIAYGEERHMIIVTQYYDHYVALPVFTHHGTGVKNKQNPYEYITLYDDRRENPARPKTVNGTLTTGVVDPGVYIFRRRSVVHLTAPVYKNFYHPVVREGELTAESTAHMLTLYLQFSSHPPGPNDGYGNWGDSLVSPPVASFNDLHLSSKPPG